MPHGDVGPLGLVLPLLLVGVAIALSWIQRLGLERTMIWASVRAIAQLLAVAALTLVSRLRRRSPTRGCGSSGWPSWRDKRDEAEARFLVLGAAATTTTVVGLGVVRRLFTPDHCLTRLVRPFAA